MEVKKPKLADARRSDSDCPAVGETRRQGRHRHDPLNWHLLPVERHQRRRASAAPKTKPPDPGGSLFCFSENGVQRFAASPSTSSRATRPDSFSHHFASQRRQDRNWTLSASCSRIAIWMQSRPWHSGQFMAFSGPPARTPPNVVLESSSVAQVLSPIRNRGVSDYLEWGHSGRASDERGLSLQEQRRGGPAVLEEPAARGDKVVGAGRAEGIEVRGDLARERVIENRQSRGVVVSEQGGRGMPASRLRAESHGHTL